jgi:hypothetical protein
MARAVIALSFDGQTGHQFNRLPAPDQPALQTAVAAVTIYELTVSSLGPGLANNLSVVIFLLASLATVTVSHYSERGYDLSILKKKSLRVGDAVSFFAIWDNG